MAGEHSPQPLTAAIIGLTFAYGAYMTEIFRAGIQSIPKGQMEAARSLGMNYIQAMRYIILPQAVRVILPPVSNEFVTLLKDSSLVSILAVADLTRRGREFVARQLSELRDVDDGRLLYLVMTLFFSASAPRVERRMTVEEKRGEDGTNAGQGPCPLRRPMPANHPDQNVHKWFGRVHALDGVSLDVKRARWW